MIKRIAPSFVLFALLGCHRSPAINAACAGREVSDQGTGHVNEPLHVDYVGNPPTSGKHWPCWAPWGSSNVVVPPERWMHNLEHGGVVLLYRCADATSCPAARAALDDLLARAPDALGGGRRLLVTAAPTLPSAFAAVAWDFVLLEDNVDANALLCFIAAHEGNGPEDVAANPSPNACPQSYAPDAGLAD